MPISFQGQVVDDAELRIGFIGCGSHSFRNIYPVLAFTRARLEAVCDLDRTRAEAFANQFDARRAYDDHRQMLRDGGLEAVFIVTGYDDTGRPRYPDLAIDCLQAGCHVWMEKPPAASCAAIERIQAAAAAADRQVMVGFKKMFCPANAKARELMRNEDFGRPQLLLLQYPQYVPPVDELRRFTQQGQKIGRVTGFLDHLCHPVSLMVFLLGTPRTLWYERSDAGAGIATFTFASGAVCSLALTHGAASNGGMEQTVIIGENGHRIVVTNNLQVRYDRTPPAEPGTGYGTAPNYYTGRADQTSAIWEPEFSLGQLYNKGLFLLGYWGEVNAFVRAVLDGRAISRGTLEQAWQVTRIFEAFARGPCEHIDLDTHSTTH